MRLKKGVYFRFDKPIKVNGRKYSPESIFLLIREGHEVIQIQSFPPNDPGYYYINSTHYIPVTVSPTELAKLRINDRL